MAIWTCPACDRDFGSEGRSHTCRPGMTIEQYLADALPATRGLHEAVLAHVSALDGDLIVDPLDAGIMYKHDAMFAMLTSKTKWVALTVQMPRRIESERVSRKVIEYGPVYSHVFNLTDASEVDDEMCGWLTEAFYRRHGHPDEMARPSADPMVPDDVDLGPLA